MSASITPIELVPCPEQLTRGWPTHATVAFAPGELQTVADTTLTENDVPLLADLIPVERWPDYSVKRLHVHAVYKQGAHYSLVHFPGGQQAPAGHFPVNMHAIRRLPFFGLSFIDDRGIRWASEFDPDAEAVLEHEGMACIVLRVNGTYQSSEYRVAPFARFMLRITSYANSNIIKFDYATTFTDDMRRHGIQQMGCDVRAIGLNPATFAMVERDQGLKLPMRLDAALDTFWQWPPDVAASADLAKDLTLGEVYKFNYLRQGKGLDIKLPNEYFDVLKAQTESKECLAEFARTATFEGTSMRSQFAVIIGMVPMRDASLAEATEIEEIRKLFQANPIAVRAVPPPPSIPSIEHVDEYLRNGLTGWWHQSKRYNDIGWHIYGNTHEQEFMDPPHGRPSLHRVWCNNHYGQSRILWEYFAEYRHTDLLNIARAITDNHGSVGMCRTDRKAGYYDGYGVKQEGPSTKFHATGAFWHCKAFLPNAGRDYGMDRNDSDAGLTGHWIDPSGLLLAWLIDGDRWAMDGYVIWLKNVKWPTGGIAREANNTLSHMLTAYDYLRGFSEHVVATGELKTAIQKMAAEIIQYPLQTQTPGPLFEPNWLYRYYKLFPTDGAFNAFILTSATQVDVTLPPSNCLSLLAAAYEISHDPIYLARGMDAIDYVCRTLFEDPTGVWEDHGLSPGLTDASVMATWPRFAATCRKANEAIPASTDNWGSYFTGQCRHSAPSEWVYRGVKIYILKGEGPLTVTPRAVALAGGDIHATAMQVLDMAGTMLLEVPRLKMSFGEGTEAVTTVYYSGTVPLKKSVFDLGDMPPGLYEVRFGSNQFAPYQPIGPGCCQAEAQLLHRVNHSASSEPCVHEVAVARGVLMQNVPTNNSLKITCMGRVAASHVVFSGLGIDRWLRSGEQMQVVLPNRPNPIEIFSQGGGWVKIEINSALDEPLFFGKDEAACKAIRDALATH